MKHLKLILLIFIMACMSQKPTTKEVVKLNIEENEKQEYDVIVFDAGYDSFVLKENKPMHFYSEGYYRSKNIFYVSSWNSKASSSGYKPPYECTIDYEMGIEYGIEVEYKLYMFFKYMEYKHNLKIYEHL